MNEFFVSKKFINQVNCFFSPTFFHLSCDVWVAQMVHFVLIVANIGGERAKALLSAPLCH